MPIHDWTRVSAGTFHHFHNAWITHLAEALNVGVLPGAYYAMAEQVTSRIGPDVVTLEAADPADLPDRGATSGVLSVADAPPNVRIVAEAEMAHYVTKRNRLVIRHSNNDRMVALIELVSPGNKGGRKALRSFLKKAAAALARGYHLLVIDLFPPTRRDPHGIHAALWEEIGEGFPPAPDKPLTLASYSAGYVKTAYVEPVAVDNRLPDMPLFL